MDLPDLTADCSRCEALCCVLLAFDAGEDFALDKPACRACPHLRGTDCGIHAGLADQGFSGCVAFDCQGAGQRLTQSLFKGQSWRRDPSLLPRLDAAFHDLRRIHQALWLLVQAKGLALPAESEDRRRALVQALSADFTEHTLTTARPILAEVQDFLASLRDLASVRSRLR